MVLLVYDLHIAGGDKIELAWDLVLMYHVVSWHDVNGIQVDHQIIKKRWTASMEESSYLSTAARLRRFLCRNWQPQCKESVTVWSRVHSQTRSRSACFLLYWN